MVVQVQRASFILDLLTRSVSLRVLLQKAVAIPDRTPTIRGNLDHAQPELMYF